MSNSGAKKRRQNTNNYSEKVTSPTPAQSFEKRYKWRLLYILGTLTLLNIIAGTFFVIKLYFALPPPPYNIENDFEIWNIRPEKKFAKEAAATSKPVVIKGSVITKWEAMKHWNTDYLARKIGTLHHVYNNSVRWFGPYYEPSKPLTPFVTRRNPYKDDTSISSKRFFEHITNSSNNNTSYLYYSGGIDSIGQWALGEVQPIEELISLNPRYSSINVWFGEPGVIAHMHYDGYHNFYAQIQGRKKFTVFSPAEWKHLYPYPFLHPHHAQAQVNISNENDTEKFPFISQATGMEITLEPGDLLYLPPLWFHHVEALETSISVNAWTDTEQTQIVEKIFASTPPLSRWMDRTRSKAIALTLLLDRLFERVCTRKKCFSLIEEGLWNRYNTTYQVVVKRVSTYQLFKLHKIRYKLTGIVLEDSIQDTNPWGDEYSGVLCEGVGLYEDLVRRVSEEMDGDSKPIFNAYVQNIANFVAQLPDDTWEIWLGNYIEGLILTVSEVPMEMVGNFLKYSFSCLELAFVNNLF